MNTDTPRMNEFRTPPPYPDLSKPAPDNLPRMTPEHLDRLDRVAALLIKTKTLAPGQLHGITPLRIFQDLAEHERIYVALAANDEDLLHFQRVTIAEAIDRLGWHDASAMVARWSKRKG